MFYFTYIMASRPGGVIYTGYTNDIWRRHIEHREGTGSQYSARYKCAQLVWFEWHQDSHSAFTRERQIKKWDREWKIELIEILNPEWNDLSADLSEYVLFDPKREGPFRPE